MIVKLICTPLFLLVKGLISFIPAGFTLPDWGVSLFAMIQKFLFFFPADVFVVILSYIISSVGMHSIWSIIEWVYKKIPGVN